MGKRIWKNEIFSDFFNNYSNIITVISIIVGANYFLYRDLKSDLDKFEKRMEIIDTRWATLFERFHILDKDMEKFRIAKRH